jgi:hypothetical protein
MSNSAIEDLSPGQAQYVLGRILQDRKVRARDISNYLKEMDQEIQDLERRLSSLKGAREQARPSGRKSGRAPARKTAKRKSGAGRKGAPAKGSKTKKAAAKTRHSRKATTPEARKSRQLQGQYISLIKRFPTEARDKYKTIASSKGRAEAVSQMKKDLGR